MIRRRSLHDADTGANVLLLAAGGEEEVQVSPVHSLGTLSALDVESEEILPLDSLEIVTMRLPNAKSPSPMKGKSISTVRPTA